MTLSVKSRFHFKQTGLPHLDVRAVFVLQTYYTVNSLMLSCSSPPWAYQSGQANNVAMTSSMYCLSGAKCHLVDFRCNPPSIESARINYGVHLPLCILKKTR